MLALYITVICIWAICASMTVFTSAHNSLDEGRNWLIAMWIACAAVIITGCFL